MKYYKDEITITGTKLIIQETGETLNILKGDKISLENGTTAYKASSWMLFLNNGGADPVLSVWTPKAVSVSIRALL